MAGHLLTAGHDLTIWSRTPGKTDELARLGAAVAPSLSDLGARCEIVFLCVTKTEDVQQCLDELTLQAAPGTLFVDHSTIAPKGAIGMHRSLGEAGFRFIDAPITGGSMGAQKGQLTIFCGGESTDIDEAKPVMAAYAKRAEFVGGPGAGQMMKMANQIAVGGALLALCESLSFAKKAGLDIGLTRELLAGGAAGSWAFENYGPKIITADWSPGFSVANQVKDFGYCLEAASDIGAALPGTNLTNELLEQMLKEGDAGLTTAALYKKMLELGA
jgi:3-hydroxyisobutyrate dehydrogenase-like beta-hydroxyacid dehydrogenase